MVSLQTRVTATLSHTPGTRSSEKSSGFSDSRNSATQASRSSTVQGRTEGTTTGAPAATGTPPDDCREPRRRASFLKVTTRPRPAPASSPPPAPEDTTPHCGEPPGREGTGGTPETQAPAPAGTCTSATTNRGDNDSSGAAPSTPEDPQSLKSPTLAQAVDERLERLASAGYRQSRKQIRKQIQKHGHH
ncbi:MARCKS-related protein-like [Procambarus clarkii]|uniref:MARCKS-related protein-like n=1 Tax=Procambarus clarkii TaxID=6728 RepID=UPI0037444F96